MHMHFFHSYALPLRMAPVSQVMAVMSIAYGHFAIEFDTAEHIAVVLLSECHE